MKLDSGCWDMIGGGVADRSVFWLKERGAILWLLFDGGIKGCWRGAMLFDWPNDGKAACCCCFCWLCSWLIVGFFWFWRACWAKNGLLSWPDELLVVNVFGCELNDKLPPNGFVLFGRAGIRFSKLTREEFSPRKLSGVLRWLAVWLNDAFDDVSLSSDCEKRSSDDGLALPEFHGLVEVFWELFWLVVSLFDVPKKSPNGSTAASRFKKKLRI